MLADTLTIMVVSGVANPPAAVAVGLLAVPAVGSFPEVRMH